MLGLLGLLALTFVSAADIPHENGVLVLTSENFDQAIKDNPNILVEFYAPWCGHCKALAPEYEKAAKKLSDLKIDAKLAKVDATIHKDLAEKHKVQGFPTLNFFRDGEKSDYQGPREADGIVNWLEKKLGPPATSVKTAEEVTKQQTDDNVLVLGYFKKEDSDDAKAYLKAASLNDAQKFFITADAKVAKELGLKKEGVVLIKKFDDGNEVFDGEMKNVGSWVKYSAIPLVNEFNQETAQVIFGSDVKAHLLTMLPEDENAAKAKEELKKAAKKVRGKITVVTIDTNKEDNQQILEFFGLKKDDLPTYIIYEMEQGDKFLSGKKDMKADKIGAFMQDYLDGKLQKHMKSEDLPKDWNEKPVKYLVGSNFNEVVMDKSKDVFVKFYAPWCGHCKQLVPIWEKLAEKFADNKKVTIAKLDATANDLDDVKVEGFPTLKMWKRDTNEVIDYSGPRDLDDLVKFVETGEIKKSEKDEDEDEDEDFDEEDEEDEDEAKHTEL